MYIVAWSVYAGACVVALACLFWLTEKVPYLFLRWFIRLLFVALCFTPVQVQSDVLWFAPAIAAIALDVLAKNMASAIAHGGILLASILLSVVVAALLAFILPKAKASE